MRIILGALAALLIVAIIAIVIIFQSLDHIVEVAIERYGSEAAGAAVSVRGVEIALTEGRGTIRGLSVANPDGFTSRNAFALEEITLGLDLESIGKDLIVVDQLVVAGPVVHYELNAQGKNNLGTLAENASGGSGSAAGSEAGSSSGESPKLAIRKLVFRDGTISGSAAGEDIADVRLPSFELSNLGGSSGAPPEQIGKQILTQLARRGASAVAKAGIESRIPDIKEKVGETGDKLLRGLLKKGE